MLDNIKKQLSSSIEPSLIECLISSYISLKQNYYIGKHKPSELDAGHFVEVVVRILQYITNSDHSYTPLGKRLTHFDREVVKFAQLPAVDYHDSLRLHIPKVIHTIYGIRNRRGVAHLGGDINPNKSDSTFVMTSCDWIMTELIRLYYTSSLEEAQKIVDTIVERKFPIIQDFQGFLKILNPKISVPNKILLLLYYRGDEGASTVELRQWIKTKSTSHIPTALASLDHEKSYIYRNGSSCFITRTGIRFVEEKLPLQV